MGQGSRALFPQYGQFVEGDSGASPVQIWSRHQPEVRVGGWGGIRPIAEVKVKNICISDAVSWYVGWHSAYSHCCHLEQGFVFWTVKLVELRSRFAARGLRFQSTSSKKRKKGGKMLLNENPELCLHVKYEGGRGRGEQRGRSGLRVNAALMRGEWAAPSFFFFFPSWQDMRSVMCCVHVLVERHDCQGNSYGNVINAHKAGQTVTIKSLDVSLLKKVGH